MVQRCTNFKNPTYRHYGARGITVCARWLNSYENFLADMGRRPSLTHSLERKKGHLGYTPTNCVWADRIKQNNNTSRNHLLTYNDETLTLVQWAQRRGLKPSTLRMRVGQYGWDLERALMTPA